MGARRRRGRRVRGSRWRWRHDGRATRSSSASTARSILHRSRLAAAAGDPPGGANRFGGASCAARVWRASTRARAWDCCRAAVWVLLATRVVRRRRCTAQRRWRSTRHIVGSGIIFMRNNLKTMGACTHPVWCPAERVTAGALKAFTMRQYGLWRVHDPPSYYGVGDGRAI